MKHRWAARLLVLALTAFMPYTLAAQGTSKTRHDPQTGTTLGQNYPNPFNPETWIPFRIGLDDSGACIKTGHLYTVRLRVYNVLAQLVAVPRLQGGNGDVPGGQKLDGHVVLPCGEYTAWWNGNYLDTDREVASGVYIYRLEVDGRALTWKGTVAK